MEQGSIGEFAKEKVSRLLNWIHKTQPDVTYDEAMYLINHIGDHSAARQLKKMAAERLYEDKNAHKNLSDIQKDEELGKWMEKLTPIERDAVERYIKQVEKRHD